MVTIKVSITFVIGSKINMVIAKTESAFLTKTLSSERPKEVWSVIYRVLKPRIRPIHAEQNQSRSVEQTFH